MNRLFQQFLSFVFYIATCCFLITCEQPEILIPVIEKVIPQKDSPGSIVRITGQHLEFGTWVNIGGERLLYRLSKNKDTAFVIIPKNIMLPPDNYDLFIETVKNKSNSLPFTLLPKSASFEVSDFVDALIPWKIKLNYVGTIKATLCEGSSNATSLELETDQDSTILIQIPKSIWYDQDTVICKFKITVAEVVVSDTKSVGFFNPKNPKFHKTSFSNILAEDTITLIGKNLDQADRNVLFDETSIAEFIFSSNDSISFIVPNNLKQIGKILQSTAYGQEEANYSIGDEADRIPIIDGELKNKIVYSDDQIRIEGNNFSKYGDIDILFVNQDQDTIIVADEDFAAINDELVFIDLPPNEPAGSIIIKNQYGRSSAFEFEVREPPLIQTILPRSNPVGGPVYIYGKNLLSASSVIFTLNEQEREVDNIEVYSRCFDLFVDTCDIITLNVPQLAVGTYDVFISIKENSNEVKRSKNPKAYEIIQNYDPNTFAGAGSTNVILPNPPQGASVTDAGNIWIVANNNSFFQIIQEDFDDSDGFFEILDDFNNSIGKYKRDGTYIEITINNLDYQGQFDDAYRDLELGSQFDVKRIVLIPTEQGNVLQLVEKNAGIAELSKSQYKAGEELVLNGFFLEENYDFIYEVQNDEKGRLVVTSEANSTITFNLPADMPADTYTIFLQDFSGFDNFSNRRTLEIIP